MFYKLWLVGGDNKGYLKVFISKMLNMVVAMVYGIRG